MNKRGQITIFIILGIIILLIIAFIYYAKDLGIGISNEEFLSIKQGGIEEQLKTCADEISQKYLDLIGKQGGSLNPTLYRFYNGYKVNYLCTNIANDKSCANRMLLKEDIELELENKLKEDLEKCAPKKSFDRFGYKADVKDPKIDVNIQNYEVLFEIDYPVTLIKGNLRLEIPKVNKRVHSPLGELYYVVQDIIESEALIGDFETVIYMLSKKSRYLIEKKKPYPDKVYILRVKDNPYIFQFAIEGEEEVIR